ncbi:SigE family RNA polymerase sigma factor [Dactylosporangium maewongense]|uniref:SigE family RNA polymerase sigma factor n=1 Tax=Dactylosporangium maewongense TaxID=634393 RepID=A0ABP4KW51_9ACTN
MTDLNFADFYAATFGPLTAQLHAFIGDHGEAQDVVQEAFCRAYARWPAVSRYDNPVSWVRRVAWNLAISRWRGARRLLKWRRDLLPPAVPDPSDADQDLVRALAGLTANHRQAVVLHYLAGFSVREIAQFTGVAEGTVKSWLSRGRAALQARLGIGDGEVSNA